MDSIRIAAILAAFTSLTGCVGHPTLTCLPGEQLAVLDRLYFGTDTPDGGVAPEAWARFLNREVTPRFPKGLTTWDASGQWRSAAGVIQPEASHILHIVHPGDPDSETSLRVIVGLYKSRFRQESVLRVRSQVCASF
ncbi:DUF3574 domain-containing protein [Methylomagnum sp.]